MSLKESSSFSRFFSTTSPTITEDICFHNGVIPQYFKLSQNQPNPVKDITYIRFQIPFECPVELKIFDLTGDEVKTLVDEIKEPGCYAVNWDGTDEEGKRLPSGIYLYHMQTYEFIDLKKILLF